MDKNKQEAEKQEIETAYCYGCKEQSMILSENGIIYECEKCGDWCYSSS